MDDNPEALTFEPSFKATTIDIKARTVEVVKGLKRVCLPLAELQRSLAGQLLIQDLQNKWIHRIWTLFQVFVLHTDQQDPMFISGEGPGCVGLPHGPVCIIHVGKNTISAPKSVLKATWAGLVLLKNWYDRTGYLCT
jgi:hypothetical protein